jgi:hypothetical protein
MDETALHAIPGATSLIERFGRWPSFHDSEVLQMDLRRAGSSEVKIHIFEMTGDLDERGSYINRNHTIVTFHLIDVEVHELSGFNHQNVLSGIAIRKTELAEYEFDLDPIYGVGARLSAKTIGITHEARIPEGSVYAASAAQNSG